MTKENYLSSAKGWTIDDARIAEIGAVYSDDLPELLKRIVSHVDKPCFLQDGSHVMSFAEILEAEGDLGVAFSEECLIPIVDRCDGDYVVYDYGHGIWGVYNINDGILFKQRKKLDSLL